jgi:hypothetical protein
MSNQPGMDNGHVDLPVADDSSRHDSEADFEDILDDKEELPLAPHIKNPSAWIEHGGKQIHKTSICRLVINPDYVRKSHERPLRVRNYTCDLKPRNYNSDNIIDSNAFIIGDLFATLICCDKMVALAVLKSVAIYEKGVRVDRVRGESLPHSAAGIKLTGQILDMRSVHSNSLDQPSASETTNEPSDIAIANGMPRSWVWNGSFVKLDLDQTNPCPVSKAARKTIAITVSSTVCEPINAHVASLDNRLPSDGCEELNDAGITWELSDDELALISIKVWETVKEGHVIGILPRFRANNTFPYRDSLRGMPFAVTCQSQLIFWYISGR